MGILEWNYRHEKENNVLSPNVYIHKFAPPTIITNYVQIRMECTDNPYVHRIAVPHYHIGLRRGVRILGSWHI